MARTLIHRRRKSTELLPYSEAIKTARIQGETWHYIAACLAVDGITLPTRKGVELLRSTQATLARCREHGVDVPQLPLPTFQFPTVHTMVTTSTKPPVVQQSLSDPVTTERPPLFGGKGNPISELFLEITSDRYSNHSTKIALPKLTVSEKTKEIYPDIEEKIAFWRNLYKDGFVPRVADDIMSDDEAANESRATLDYVDKLTYELPRPFEGFDEVEMFGYRSINRMRFIQVKSNEEISIWIARKSIFGDFHPGYRFVEMDRYSMQGYKDDTRPVSPYLDEQLKQYVSDNITLWLALLTGLVIQPIILTGYMSTNTEQEHVNDMSLYIPKNEKRR